MMILLDADDVELRYFPSFKNPHFQNEAICKPFGFSFAW